MLYRKGFGGVTVRIICKDLSFTYEPKKKNRELVLDNISFTINEGEFFGIVGHTGSGKSTLIQHLNALIPLQSGQLFVGDFDLSCKDKDYKKRLKDLRSKVGMVFQYPEYQLFAETVFEDVAFGLKNFCPNLSEEEVVKRTKQAIELVGLNFFEVKDKSPFDLSGGQKRRVAIAGVLVSNPEILVLDEPVAGLDPQGKRELIALLHSL
ncbi:MAG: ATP-binding cassette domain-containing protein, partial [Clostridia bacterium]|nr:ATP-binding cassette domain-containing protein [Clostridia bacterium]